MTIYVQVYENGDIMSWGQDRLPGSIAIDAPSDWEKFSIAKSATSILRQLVDAGTLSNLPAGLKARGLRIKGDSTPLMQKFQLS